jgi:hypothetical protein
VKAHENPFRASRIEALAFRLDGGWDALLARLEAASWRGAVVGPRGTGKTTFLEALAPRLAARGFRPRFVRLSEERPEAPDGAFEVRGGADVVLLDGAEQLGFFAGRRAARHPRIVATQHRPGRLPTLIETKAGGALLDDLLGELLGAEAGAWRDRARSLLRERGGDVREVWRSLYDAWAGAGGAGGRSGVASENSRGEPAASCSSTEWLSNLPRNRV